MIEGYEDALKNSNKELEDRCRELEAQNKEIRSYCESLEQEYKVLKAQMDIVHLIFGR